MTIELINLTRIVDGDDFIVEKNDGVGDPWACTREKLSRAAARTQSGAESAPRRGTTQATAMTAASARYLIALGCLRRL